MKRSIFSLIVLSASLIVIPACVGGGDNAGTDSSAAIGQDGSGTGEDGAADCSCEGVECGMNACGESCGACTGGLVCASGACAEPGTDPLPQGDCAINGFSPAAQEVALNPADAPANFYRYQAVSALEAPLDRVQIQSYFDFGGPNTPGTYDLSGSNFADCGLCVIAHTGCTADGCEKSFFADTGSITIDTFGMATGEKFVGAMEGVIMREVTIDPDTYKSTLVPDGDTWCMDGYDFSAALKDAGPPPPAGADAPACGGDNLGTMVGSSIANFKLQNCNGEWVNLHRDCNSAAVHIFGTAGWCGACSETLKDIAGQLGGTISPASIDAATPGLKMWIVLSEDSQGGPPNLAFCKSYAQGNNLDPSMVFMDNSQPEVSIPLVSPEGYAVGLNGFGTIYSFINPYLSAQGNSVSMGVPWNAVLKGANMEYYWSDYYDASKWYPKAISEVISGQ